MLNYTFFQNLLTFQKKKSYKEVKETLLQTKQFQKSIQLTNVTKAINIYAHVFDLENKIKVILIQKRDATVQFHWNQIFIHPFVTDVNNLIKII